MVYGVGEQRGVDKVVIKLVIDYDDYKLLEAEAKREGYYIVSDYVRELIKRHLKSGGRGLEGLELKELSRELYTQLAKRLEKLIVDLLNPFTGKIDNISSQLAELIERIDSLAAKRGLVEEKAITEEKKVVKARKGQTAIERLKSQGVIFLEDVKWMKAPEKFFQKLEREGAVVFNLEDDKIAVDKDFWDKFNQALENISTKDPDDVEALITAELGEQAGKLFKKLLGSGIVYYDEDLSKWIVTVP